MLPVALGALAGIVGLMGGGLYVFQERLLYLPQLPSRTYDVLPSNFAGLGFEDVFLRSADGTRIHSWLVYPSADEAREAPRSTLLYFHGNAGNLAHRLPDVQSMVALCSCNVLMVSYRGYGMSEGSPSESGIKQDARAALEYCLAGGGDGAHISPRRLYVFGRSIGGAVALWLAHQYPNVIRGVIVENTFTSVNDMIDTVFPRMLRWVKRLNRNRWDTLSFIPDVRVPVLFLSGRRDELVPPRHMDILYELCRNGASPLCKMVHIEDGTHNDTWYRGGRLYYESITSFIEEAQKLNPQQQPQ